MDTLNEYLEKYRKFEADIFLCSSIGGYRKRVMYGGEGWMPNDHYNHRIIGAQEIVVEFDDNNPEVNGRAIAYVTNRALKHRFQYSVWTSGNKSIHFHIWFNFGNVGDVALFKRLLIQYLVDDDELKAEFPKLRPDLQLAVPRHLIRAEYGLHEKTNRIKTRVSETKEYPKLNPVPESVWLKYREQMLRGWHQAAERKLDSLDAHPLVDKMLDTDAVKLNDDGRERILFVLAHVLKPKYTEWEELSAFLYSWYTYSGGKKLSRKDVDNKVKYHWSRQYKITPRYLRTVLEDVGISESKAL